MELKDKVEDEAREKFEQSLEEMKRTTLSINRIPEQYKTRFLQIARKEFSKDYGMCLREMIRTWDNVYINPNEEVNAKIEILAEEVNNLKIELAKLTAKPKAKEMTMADGTKKRIGR